MKPLQESDFRARRHLLSGDRNGARQVALAPTGFMGARSLQFAGTNDGSRIPVNNYAEPLRDKIDAKGQRLGRPRSNIDPRRIRALRAQGLAWRAIAKQLGGLARNPLSRRL